MSKEKRKAASGPEAYLATVESLEPDIHQIDSGAFYASAAISLKRIADALEKLAIPQTIVTMGTPVWNGSATTMGTGTVK